MYVRYAKLDRWPLISRREVSHRDAWPRRARSARTNCPLARTDRSLQRAANATRRKCGYKLPCSIRMPRTSVSFLSKTPQRTGYARSIFFATFFWYSNENAKNTHFKDALRSIPLSGLITETRKISVPSSKNRRVDVPGRFAAGGLVGPRSGRLNLSNVCRDAVPMEPPGKLISTVPLEK